MMKTLTLLYYGSYGGKEVQMIRTGPRKFKVIAEVTGETRDEEGTKSVWKTLDETERYEITA